MAKERKIFEETCSAKEMCKIVINSLYGVGKEESDNFRAFCKNYPFKEVRNNPFKLAEALFYLKCIKIADCNEDWVSEVRRKIIVTLALYDFNR